MTLSKMVADPNTTIAEIGAWLDAMDHVGRAAAMSTSTKKDQRLLWEKAAAAPPMTQADFVPEHVPPTTAVPHVGRNTLPAFNSFKKVFCKPDDGSERLFGYNDAPTGWLIGPGYYVAHPTEGHPAWEARGSWVVDYFLTPDGPVPDSWPSVRPNHVGLQILVYHRTRDFMRKVSEHVSIGMAFKNESSLNNWFTLVRQDPEI